MEENLTQVAESPIAENIEINENNMSENIEHTSEDNATKRYSERLNKDRAKIRQEFEDQLNTYKDMEESIKALGYEGEDASGLTETLKAELNKRENEGIPDNPIVYKALEIAMMHKRMQDLEEIKKFYPECDASDSRNIGEIFTKLMQTGNVDAVTAYEAQMAYNKRNAVKEQESMGSVKAEEGSNIKDYYTPEEAGRFTRKDYDRNPGLWEKVRSSMLKWK